MDEILLTHDQQGDAIDTALARCTRDKELSPVHTVAEEVSRAQVRKVVEAVAPQLDEIASLFWDIRNDWTDPRSECREGLNIVAGLAKALREAAGEEK